MHRWLPGLVVLAGLVVASCGSSSASQSGDATPSEQAKMVCEQEAQEDIAATLGVNPTRVSTPTWDERLYSCEYVYADGVISLSVKELANADATTRYFEQLAEDKGQRAGGVSLGEGAFTTPTQVVVRKDFMVLDVDVSDLPAQFGQPPRTNADVKLAVAETLLNCWV